MGIYYRMLGLIFWIIGVVSSLAYYDVIQTFGNYTYVLWLGLTVIIGLLFIALGEVMILLKHNLKQNQDLYKLFENWGGENQ